MTAGFQRLAIWLSVCNVVISVIHKVYIVHIDAHIIELYIELYIELCIELCIELRGDSPPLLSKL